MSTAQDRSRWKQIEFAIGREDWKQARKLIRMWLRRSPNSHWLLTRMGLTYYEQRQYRRALGYERRAMRIAPRCPLVMWDYAGTLDMLGRKKEALALFRRLLNRGEKALADGPCGEGRKWARALMADCLYRIGTILEEEHQRKRAVRAYTQHLARRKRGAQSIYPLREVVRKYKALLSQVSQYRHITH
jgi:tetratricopeptide (TPR) repeat protein